MTMQIKPIIGLEVHVELETKSKMFCGCDAFHFDREPNTQTCPVCLGLPGALPVPNKEAIRRTLMIGKALSCEINELSKFDRKNYFYPDLPKGYQISQYDQPFCINGKLEIKDKSIGIERVHLEEDTGKLQHAEVKSRKVSLIDFNRSGVPLVEIVSKPEMNSSEEAKEYLKKLRKLIVWLGVSSADMEKGQMRLEPTINVEITKDGKKYFTPLVEVKNINSFNFAAQAIEYEVKRQVSEWEETGVVKDKGNKTTRGYDSAKKITYLMRSKEEASDYRYFPEPDIPPIVKAAELLKGFEMPQLPDEYKKEMAELGVREDYAEILTDDKERAVRAKELALSASKEKLDADKAVGMVINQNLVDFEPGKIIAELRKEESWEYADTDQVRVWISEAIASNPQAVEDYKSGKETVIQYLMGQVMRLGKGKADPKSLVELIRRELV